MPKVLYPLQQVLEVKEKRVKDAEKLVKEKKELKVRKTEIKVSLESNYSYCCHFSSLT